MLCRALTRLPSCPILLAPLLPFSFDLLDLLQNDLHCGSQLPNICGDVWICGTPHGESVCRVADRLQSLCRDGPTANACASCMATDQRTDVRKGSAMGGHEHENGGSDTDLMLSCLTTPHRVELTQLEICRRDRKNPFRPCSRHPSSEVNSLSA